MARLLQKFDQVWRSLSVNTGLFPPGSSSTVDPMSAKTRSRVAPMSLLQRFHNDLLRFVLLVEALILYAPVHAGAWLRIGSAARAGTRQSATPPPGSEPPVWIDSEHCHSRGLVAVAAWGEFF